MVGVVESVQLLGRIANAIGAPGDTPEFDQIKAEAWLEPRLIRLHYGSPCEVIIQLAGPIVSSVGAMSAAIFAMKRLWKLPTEMRTHSQEVEAKFLDAETRAIEALQRRDEAQQRYLQSTAVAMAHVEETWGELRAGDRLPVFERLRHHISPAETERTKAFESIDLDFDWPRGTVAGIEKSARKGWVGESSTWFAGDEPFVD